VARRHYRAEQVGSLLRPDYLLRAREAHVRGELPVEELRGLEDQATLEGLELQRSVGLDIFTDGEFRRSTFQGEFPDALEGFQPHRISRKWKGQGGGTIDSARPVVAGKLRQKRRLTEHELPFLKKHSPGPFKITLPSATQFTDPSYVPGITDRYYASRSDLLQELVQVLRREIRGLLGDGVTYVQIDAPRYTYYIDPELREHLRQSGIDLNAALDEAIAADNACLDQPRSNDVTLAMHLCRGNARSHWYAEGGYDAIAEKMFNSLEVDTFLLEYDSDRAGSFEPLRFVPRDKSVVLGLITTKESTLESQDELLRRIDAAAKYLPLDNLALSPQCGFASVAEGNLITPDAQRRKLELVAQTARKVWG
jgi:5-methyltetrahydropteroyltriglutamate--homocysteine methyltransferase